LGNYDDLLEHLEGYRSNDLEEDWLVLEEILDEYDSLPTCEEEEEEEEEEREPAVNDRVRVIDYGACYTTYSDWVEKYISEPSEKYLFDYGNSCDYGDEGKILFIAPHEYGNTTLAYVRMDNGKCYLIELKSLRKI
jgi:FtsZ-interacting cell division protein YlmF